MSISYNYARQFVGRPIMAHCRDGRRHYGIVSNVTPHSLHLRSMPYQYVSGKQDFTELAKTAELNNQAEMKVDSMGFYGRRGFGPGFWGWGAGLVLPLYVLLAISLFWW